MGVGLSAMPAMLCRVHSSLTTLAVAKAATPTVGDPLTFYSVAATIIPVLFLALVYEAKALVLLAPLVRLNVAQAVGVLTVGTEAACFRVLANQHPTHHAAKGISTVMLLMGLAVIAQPQLGALDRDRAARRQERATLLELLDELEARNQETVSRLGADKAELEKLYSEYIAGALQETAAEARRDEIQARVRDAEQRSDEQKHQIADYKARAEELVQRYDTAGVPLPAWVVLVGLAAFGIFGVLKIYGVI